MWTRFLCTYWQTFKNYSISFNKLSTTKTLFTNIFRLDAGAYACLSFAKFLSFLSKIIKIFFVKDALVRQIRYLLKIQ